MPKTAIQAAESHIIEGIKKQNLRAGALWSRKRGLMNQPANETVVLVTGWSSGIGCLTAETAATGGKAKRPQLRRKDQT